MDKDKKLIDCYIAQAIKQFELNEKGEASVYEDDKLRKIAGNLFENNKLELLHPLLNHDHNHVKYYAAMHLLPLYKEECMKVLSYLAENDTTLTGFNAKWTLKNYEAGRYKDDFFF